MHRVQKTLSVLLSVILFGTSPFWAHLKRARATEDVVVAVVNGSPIMKSQLDRVLLEFKRDKKKEKVTKGDVKQLLENLITRSLLLNQKEVQDLRQDERIKERVREFEEDLIVKEYFKKRIAPQIWVHDKEVKEFYQNHLYRFAVAPTVDASQILLRSKEQAEKVLAKLKNGEDFCELAKEYSIDLPLANECGRMGTLEKGKSLPALIDTLLILDEGETSDIVKTPYGYHILRADKIHRQEFKPFEEVKEDIRKLLIRKKQVKAIDELAATLRKNAQIKIYEDRLVEPENN